MFMQYLTNYNKLQTIINRKSDIKLITAICHFLIFAKWQFVSKGSILMRLSILMYRSITACLQFRFENNVSNIEWFLRKMVCICEIYT